MKRRWRLRLHRGQLHVLRRYAQVEPGRHLGHLEALGAGEQELGYDLLHHVVPDLA